MPKSLNQINAELSLATISLIESAEKFKAWIATKTLTTTPHHLSGVVGWWNYDYGVTQEGGKVTSWAPVTTGPTWTNVDTSTQPSFDSKKGLSFPVGSTQFMQISGLPAYTRPFSFVVVAESADTTAAEQFLIRTGGTAPAEIKTRRGTDGKHSWECYFGITATFTEFEAATTPGGFFAMGIIGAPSVGFDRTQTLTKNPGSRTTIEASTPWTLGAMNSSTTDKSYSGTIKSVIFFNRLITQDDVDKIRTWQVEGGTSRTPPPLQETPPTPQVLWTADYDTATTQTDYATLTGTQQTWDINNTWYRSQPPGVGGYPTADNGITPEYSRIVIADNSSVPGTGAAKPTGRAMRVHLKPYNSGAGDVGQNDASRSEVYDRYPTSSASTTTASMWPDPVDSVRWWSIPVLIPNEFELSTTGGMWLTLTQIKGFRGGSPPISLEIDRDQWRLHVDTLNIDFATVQKGVWTNFVLGAKLSTSSTNGWVELWQDGVQRVPRRIVKTMDIVNSQPDPIYLKQGIYRTKSWTVDHTVWFGRTRVGTTRDSF